jgi:uncharacterized repeat protein (TIGR01451 family)
MNRKTRLLVYLLVLSALIALLTAIPSAWATPEQTGLAQTVPTRTSEAPYEPPSDSGGDSGSSESPTAVAPTVLPGTSVPTPTLAAVAAAKLVLKKQVSPAAAWPGATLNYTLTLSNQGAAPVEQIVIQDLLPAELSPGAITSGTGAVWDGSTLRAQAAVLPPGSQLVIAYTAQVQASARPGTIISNRASVQAAGNLPAAARSTVMLPPAELPPTGGFLGQIPNTAAVGR